MKLRPPFLSSIALALAVLFAAVPARAQTYTWNAEYFPPYAASENLNFTVLMGNVAGESFQAAAGQMNAADFDLAVTAPGTDTVTVAVEVLAGSGLGGTVLGTSADVVLPGGFGTDGNGGIVGAEQVFTFSAPVTLTTASKYTLALVVRSATASGDGVALLGTDDGPNEGGYPDGQAYPAGAVGTFCFRQGTLNTLTVTETTLHSFSATDPNTGSNTDGAYPGYGSLIQAGDGNFYGTTVGGGAYASGTVYQIMPGAVLNTFYTFSGQNNQGMNVDGLDPSGGLLEQNDGVFYGTTALGGPDGYGTVYQLKSDGTLTVLNDFAAASGNAGKGSQATLIQGSDGDLYGTTYIGGTYASGTVFKITPDGTLIVLYDFAGGYYDGANPTSGLVEGNDGNFYGTTYEGPRNRGTYGDTGTIFKITPAGVQSVYIFNPAGTMGAYPFGRLLLGSDGNFYGTTIAGDPDGTGVGNGGGGPGTVFRLTPAGVLTTLCTFGPGDGNSPYGGLIEASDGNFYGTTRGGGMTAGGDGTVFQLTPAGALTTVYSFSDLDSQSHNSDGGFPVSGLIQGSDGNLYGTAPSGGLFGEGTIFRLNVALPDVVRFHTPKNSVYETAGSAVVRVDRIGGTGNLVVNYATANGTAAAGTDYTSTSGSLTWNAGDLTPKYITVQIANPGYLDSKLRTLFLTLSNPVDATETVTVGYPATATLAINGSIPGAPVIISAPMARGTQGYAFSYQIAATGSPTSFTAGPLPDGLSVSAGGLISGTPTVNGSFNIGLSASNAIGSGTATLTLSIAPPAPVITSATTAAATQGSFFSYQITASNSPTSFGAAILPGGLSVNSATGLISGTPTVNGNFGVTITASNDTGTGGAILTLTIASNVPPVVNGATTASAMRGVYFSYQITATNNPTSFGATNLPAGLSVNTATGLISGTPTVSGSFNVGLSASNAAGSGSGSLGLTVNKTPPVITGNMMATGYQGQVFTYQITATNSPTSYTATNLPSGLTIYTSTGLIAGTPTVTGNFPVSLSATNVDGTATGTLNLTITLPPPAITGSTSLTATLGSPFSYQITATGNPTSFGATGLPANLSVNTATGLISGTPATFGNFYVTLSATNANGTGYATVLLSINAAIPAITSATSDYATQGKVFSYQITAANSPTSFSATGLPAGLSVNTATGLINGTPTAYGTSTVGLSASNANGTGYGSLSLTVYPAPPTITSPNQATGNAGQPFSYQITATGNPTHYNLQYQPAWLSVNTSTGLITGTPPTASKFNVSISVGGYSGNANQLLTITIAQTAPTITSANAVAATVGQPFSYKITTSGGAPANYGFQGNPNGLSINPATGVISGTPTVAGTFTYTLNATNSAGKSSASLTVTVTLKPPVITSAATAMATQGAGFTYQLTAIGSATSYGFQGSPNGLTINPSTGVISGTPKASGTFSYTLNAYNGAGKGSAPLTLTVAVGPPVVTSAATASGTVGKPFSYQVTASYEPTAYGFQGNANGLTINASTGVISGTPKAAGTFTYTLNVYNSGGKGSATLTVTIKAQ